jgi:hypothetical protein
MYNCYLFEEAWLLLSSNFLSAFSASDSDGVDRHNITNDDGDDAFKQFNMKMPV